MSKHNRTYQGKFLKKSGKRSNKRGLKALLITAILLCVTAGAALFCLPQFHETIYLEAGTPMPKAEAFLKKASVIDVEYNAATKSAYSQDTWTTPGSYPVTLVFLGFEQKAEIIVQDTTPPEAGAQNITVYNPKQAPDPRAFIAYTEDVGAVTVSYETEPDITVPGAHCVTLCLTDAAGNASQLTATLNIVHDTQVPVISGVVDIDAYEGESVSYRTGVTVTDDLDPTPMLTIDNSQVNLSQPGTYSVSYTATDAAGNLSTVTASVTVHEKKEDFIDPEVIYQEADRILAQFITEDMTTREKVEAVYVWVRTHNTYFNHTEKGDWLQAAYKFLQTSKGDCYGFFAANKLLLHRLGIPTIDVTKVKMDILDSNHYWLLVSIDEGETYYHLDNVWSSQLCLVTDAVLDSFSILYGDNCFNRDISLYPATPEKSLPKSDLPWDDPAILTAS